MSHDTEHGNIPTGGVDRASQNSTAVTTLEDRIRLRAYEIYQQRGKRSGSAEGDWLKAKAEILLSLAFAKASSRD